MSWVLTGLSILLAVVPMVCLLGLLWFSDRYDREPLWLVFLTFLWGAIGAVFFALPLNTGFGLLVSKVAPLLAPWVDPAMLNQVAGPAIGAPLFEEPSKALFLLFVAWNRRPNNMSSGFVYGAAAGIGFATTENFFYFSNASYDLATFLWVVGVRTLYCSFLHMMCSSVVGASFGFGRLRGVGVTIVSTSAGLLSAMVLHAVWNGLLALDSFTTADLALRNFFLLPFEVLFVGFIWQLCLLDDAWSMRRQLEEEEDTGTIPEGDARTLSSFWRRLFYANDFGVERPDVYIRTATLLARRKRELALLGSRATDFYRDDVDRLRKQLGMAGRRAQRAGDVTGTR